ncbi:MAG: HlyC/CorC family transporter [Chloroflexi bacterium]|nr:HlyC/CorC family transporter [Chloroflexota bacterium]
MDTLLGLLAVFTLVGINGFFVAAEFGLVGARETRIAQLAAEGSAGAIAAQNALRHLDSYIAATQLGITLASLGLGWIGEPAVGHIFEGLLALFLPEEALHTVGQTITIAISFALVTMLHIVLGELAPKAIALQRPEQVSVFVAQPTAVFLWVFRPVISVMNNIGNFIVRALGFHSVSGHAHVHSAEELEMLVRSSREAGLLQESEERLLRRAFDFSAIQAMEIMQPRVEVDAIPMHITLPELLKLVAEQHHSRYPVYDGSIDKVVGVLHMKDLLDTLVQRPALLTHPHEAFTLNDVLRTPLFIPQTASVDKLLEKMQESKTQFAVIIDEYGGMAGVVTMEDIIEQLVGELRDEFDEGETAVQHQDGADEGYIDGLVSITEAAQRLNDPEVAPLSATMGGYVAEHLDRIARVGDVVPFGEYELRVEEMEGMRVSKLKFRRVGKR